MALATQCPNCQTHFRVQPENLKTGRGVVRCGVCHHVFNALDHLTHIATDQPSNPTVTTSHIVPNQILRAQLERNTARVIEPDQAKVAAATSAANAANPGLSAQQVEILAMLDAHVPEIENSAVLKPLAKKPVLSIADQPTPAAPPIAQWQEPELNNPIKISSPTEKPINQALSSAQETGHDPVNLRSVEPPMTTIADSGVAQTTIFEEGRVDGVTNAQAALTGASSQPNFLLAFERSVRYQRRLSRLCGVGAFLALIGLLAQITYIWRADIAVHVPLTGPWLTRACQALNAYSPCQMDLPMHIDQLRITSSDLRPAAQQRDLYTLQFAIENQSQFPQAWPHLELTLTDVQNQAVARRVFAPETYLLANPEDPKGLATNMDIASGISGGKELNVKVLFDASQIAQYKAAGYLLYIFYP